MGIGNYKSIVKNRIQTKNQIVELQMKIAENAQTIQLMKNDKKDN